MIRSSTSIHSASSIKHTENRSSHALLKVTKLSNSFKIFTTVIAAGILITAGIIALILGSTLALPCLIAGGTVFLGAVVLIAMNRYTKVLQPIKANDDIVLTSIKSKKNSQRLPSVEKNDPNEFLGQGAQSITAAALLSKFSENEKNKRAIEQFQTRLEQAANKLQTLQEQCLVELKTALETQKSINLNMLNQRINSLHQLIHILNHTKNKPLRQSVILNHQKVKKAYQKNLIELSMLHEVLLKTKIYEQQKVSKKTAIRIINHLTDYKSLVVHHYSQMDSAALFMDLEDHLLSIKALTIVNSPKLPRPPKRQKSPICFNHLSDTSKDEVVKETSF